MENWTIENFMIGGQAMLKMLGLFWGYIGLVAVVMMFWSRKELVNESR